MNQHTKSPWTADDLIHKSEDGMTSSAIWGPEGPGSGAVAWVTTDYFGQREANARLIEKAPNLYSELEMIVEAWELIDVGKVHGRTLTPFEKERYNFARDLLTEIDGD